MAVTSNLYTAASGSLAGPYSYSFPIIADTDIRVSVDGTIKTVTTHYTVDTSNTRITFVSGQEPSVGQVVIVYRSTDEDPITNTFVAGSTIRSNELNDNFKQLLYIAQETDNQALSTLSGSMMNNLTFGKGAGLVFEGDTDDANETTVKVIDPTADRTINFPNVSGTLVTTGDSGTVATGMIASDAITNAKIADNAINDENIANLQVTTAKIANDAVDSTKIADNAVTTAQLATNSVATAKIADNAVTNAKIADNAIEVGQIADNAVTTNKIINDAVTLDKIADNAVRNNHIADDAVAAGQIANSAVTTVHLTTDAVTAVKIAADAVTTNKISDDAVNKDKIAPNTITRDEIASNTITNGQIAANTITATELTSDSVTAGKIAADAVNGTKIADDSIDSEHYVNGSIDTDHIGAVQVTDAKLASNSVITSKLLDSNVTTDKIANSNITLAKLANDLKQTTVADSDTQIPTSGAVVDYVAAQIAPIGGLEVIANDASFPNTQPSAGVVISIADAGGLVVNGSGVSTTGRTVGNSTVTINGINSAYNSSTVEAGIGFLVSSTGSGQVYNFHKSVIRDQDILSISSDINDFANRYRVGSSNPTSNNDAGDLFYNTGTNKLYTWNANSSQWEEAQSVGNFFISTLSPAFDGSTTNFTLSNAPSYASQVLLTINGVVQKPNAGTSAPSDGFALDGATVKLGGAPATGAPYSAVVRGSAVNIGAPSDNTVSTVKLINGAVTTDKLADNAVTGAKIADSLDIPDNNKIRWGTGGDLSIFHDGTDNLLRAYNVPFRLQTNNDENAIVVNQNGSVELYHDNSKKFHTHSTGGTITGYLHFADGASGTASGLGIGNSDDLQLFHDGSDSYIQDANSVSDLFINSNKDLTLKIGNGSGGYHTAFYADNNGAARLYHIGSEKIKTTSTGVQVTGIINNSDAQENVRIGSAAGASFNGTNANRNTLIGHNAGNAITDGDDNTALGRNALDACTVGYSNVAVGTSALTKLTTGGDNIAIGVDSLEDCTTGVGNIGIGTTALYALTTANNNTAVGRNSGKFMTSGAANVSLGNYSLQDNTTGDSNIAVGYEALANNTTGSNNIGIGPDALKANTTASNNVAIGNSVLVDNTSGDYNVGLGIQALFENTSGVKNTALGAYAMKDNTTGNHNVAIGENALGDNTTAADNIAIGMDALRVNTTGQQNVAIGMSAMMANTTAANNVAVGAYALATCATGTSNTAVGQGALYTSTASENTAIGNKALYSCTTGAQNLAAGYWSLHGLTTGSGNTALGGNWCGSNITTGGQNVAVGESSLKSLTTGQSNVALGWGALATITTAEQNVAVGWKALNVAQSGCHYNTAVGYGAGAKITTGMRNTVIGRAVAQEMTAGEGNTLIGEQSGEQLTDGDYNSCLGENSGKDLTTGGNNTLIGYEAGRSAAPSGSVNSHNNIVCLGNDNVTDLYCADTSISSSDKRDKAEITNFTHGLSWVNKLQPKTYVWDKRSWYSDDLSATPDGSKKKSKKNIGFLAQDVLAIEQADGFASNADTMLTVDITPDGKRYGLKYERLVPVLVNAIKELSAKVTALEAA